MNRDVLDEYKERPIIVHFQENKMSSSPEIEGLLQDVTAFGILLNEDDDTLLFIPYSSIRLFEIKPKPSFWQRLTGTN